MREYHVFGGGRAICVANTRFCAALFALQIRAGMAVPNIHWAPPPPPPPPSLPGCAVRKNTAILWFSLFDSENSESKGVVHAVLAARAEPERSQTVSAGRTCSSLRAPAPHDMLLA